MTTHTHTDDRLGLVVAGWIMAFVLPLGGIIAGLALAARRPGHAIGMILVSVATICAAFWLVLLVVYPPT